MGGFAFDTSGLEQNFLPCSRTRLTIRPKGLAILAENIPNFYPNVSRKYIEDKSKASGFAKVLVCLQVSWFCAQFISRLDQGLSISVLELNTFVHSICALLIYCLWWNKPLDIAEPVTIDAQDQLQWFCALFYIESNIGGLGRSIGCVWEDFRERRGDETRVNR